MSRRMSRCGTHRTLGAPWPRAFGICVILSTKPHRQSGWCTRWSIVLIRGASSNEVRSSSVHVPDAETLEALDCAEGEADRTEDGAGGGLLMRMDPAGASSSRWIWPGVGSDAIGRRAAARDGVDGGGAEEDGMRTPKVVDGDVERRDEEIEE
ncbi:hypothetical protein DFJ73DRAFT_819325 [Zopfochytrium polystomum]|nr:hypothetical protein DFJ73DRAFT_819325 [Zopfochytrium polystomum]